MRSDNITPFILCLHFFIILFFFIIARQYNNKLLPLRVYYLLTYLFIYLSLAISLPALLDINFYFVFIIFLNMLFFLYKLQALFTRK